MHTDVHPDSHSALGETLVYRGWLSLHTVSEDHDALFLSTVKEPLVEKIEEDLHQHGNYLTVRYFIVDRELPFEDIQEEYLKRIFGGTLVSYGARYSEITGYLWTDEELQVGGHDLLEELKNNVGKFCHLEISYSKVGPKN